MCEICCQWQRIAICCGIISKESIESSIRARWSTNGKIQFIGIFRLCPMNFHCLEQHTLGLGCMWSLTGSCECTRFYPSRALFYRQQQKQVIHKIYIYIIHVGASQTIHFDSIPRRGMIHIDIRTGSHSKQQLTRANILLFNHVHVH